MIAEAIDRIVFNSDRPIVVALKGGWGEGKTFFWKNSIVAAHQSDRIGYASVFGADSLQIIRERVLLAALPKLGASNGGLFGKVSEILRQHLPVLAKGLGIPDTLTTQLLESTIIKPGWVICLDDIERLSPSIEFDELLGYISELRDERLAKVVLIYNDDEIAANGGVFRKYQEKVIDRELAFRPDVSEILRLVFRDVPTIDSHLLEDLDRRCAAVGLKNIRLIVRTREYYQEIIQVLPSGADQKFCSTVLVSLLLFVWVKFSNKTEEALNLSFLANYSELSTLLRTDSDNKKEPTSADRASELLSSYGYTFTDDLDLILIELVRTDALNTEALLKEYGKYVDSTSKGVLEKRFSDVWQKYYHGTLRNTEDEFCEGLATSTRDYMKFIPVNQIDSVLNILSRLGRGEVASQLFEQFLAERAESLRGFRRSDLIEPIRYKKLGDVLDEIQKNANVDRRSIGQVIADAADDDFLSSNDRSRLAQFSKQDFMEYFLNADQERITSIIRELARQAARFANPDADDLKIQTTVREAVVEIASQHRLNRLRMESMGLIEPAGADGESKLA